MIEKIVGKTDKFFKMFWNSQIIQSSKMVALVNGFCKINQDCFGGWMCKSDIKACFP
jgi:hypothetical protein